MTATQQPQNSFADRFSSDVPPEGDISLSQLASALLRRRRLLAALPLAIALITAVVLWFLPMHYTTRVSFTPQAPVAGGDLVGLAERFGVSLPGSEPTESPAFYADLVTTPGLLRRLAEHEYSIIQPKDTLRGSFSKLYEIDENTAGGTIDESIRTILSEVMKVDADVTTSIVRISFRTKWPDLSLQMAEELLRLVDEFHTASHQMHADAERRFIEERLNASREELMGAEDRAKMFLERNREFRNDPSLTLAYDRLVRDVSMRQTVYTSLNQMYEQARIEAVRNTPYVMILERPAPPLRADRKHIALKAALAFLLTLSFLFAAILAAELLRSRSSASEQLELAALRRETIDDLHRLRRPSGLFRKIFDRGSRSG